MASLSRLESRLTLGFPVWHLGRNLLARHLARGFSHSLLVQPLGLFLLATRRPHSLPVGSILRLKEWPEEVQRNRKNNGGILVDGDLAHRLEQPELQRRRALQPIGRLPQTLGGLVLSLSCDDLRSPLPLALCLTSHRPLHVLRDLYVLDLHHADLDPPGVGLLVYDVLELVVYGLSVGQEIVEVLLAEDAPQGSLGDLAGGEDVVLYLEDALVWVNDPEVDHGVHAGGDVVAGDDVLRRYVHGDGSEVYLDHVINEREEEEESWPLW